MDQADLQAFNKLLDELQAFANRVGLKLDKTQPTPAGPVVDRVRTYVGLSCGPHEEVADANYQRVECAFVYDICRELWLNEQAIHFPQATAPYGADAIIIEGLDLTRRVVSRMGAPVLIGTGNACGFFAGALSITPDVMRGATRQAESPEPWHVPISPEAVARAHAALGAPTPNYRAPEAPAYCERCETMSVTKYNHLVAMDYPVSHLIELPNEAGYAVPCSACRKP